ncbi:enoyl-CoA hydratase [Desulfofundulus salinus]|uniref:Enoyl-CoA hydratase domain-containing protein 3, mitochondrial n=1 Tax=Desulfofundulus salinus TaxID=2419843 RepID=A0A494WUQ3_9FIRM|nr:enoyl-CoA hydratase [Desulfofundulus salinum]RKO66603.1 enoyl-CoA hydratase [Desulfofundulus salinum]
MSYQYLLYDEEEKVGFISLNRPEKRNALSQGLLEELTTLLLKIGQEKKVKVVVLKGIGKTFSAGHDLKEIADGTPQDVLKLFQTCYLTMRAIREIPQPVIAQVHGVATAAGCQLVAAADLAVAAEDALFATPGVKIGLFCTTPAVFLSRNVGRKKAMEMLLTGEFMPAREALIYGLVNKVVPPGELETATRELAGKIARYSLSAIGAGKRAFYQQINMEDFQALNYATEVISLNTTTADAQEGIRAFLEKREPKWSDD